jgi:menaquinone-dependent protoporphyrinogen oxidase
VWLFSSGPVGDPSGKAFQAMEKDPVDVAEMRAASHARDHRLFAGKLDRTILTRRQRAALLVFRGLEGDFRDWAAITQWAQDIARQLTPAPR